MQFCMRYSCLTTTFAIGTGLAKLAAGCALMDETPPAHQPALLSPAKPAAQRRFSPDTTVPHRRR
jgi:hypothetical protein